LLRKGGKVCGVSARESNSRKSFEVVASLTIDASGRQALAISRNNWRRWEPGLNKTAIWTYFEGALRDTGKDEGNTTIAYLPEKGWFWYIPMQNDLVSVGVVAEKDYLFGETNVLPEIFRREASKNPWVEERLSKGRQVGRFYVTREYSYCSEYCAEDGLVLIGDAFLFLDPVFASGVYFALRSGELAADAADRALGQGNVSAGQFAQYAESMLREVEPMRQLVYAFYDRMFNVRELMKRHPEVTNEWTDVLLGNLDKDFAHLFAAIGEQAALPPPLSCGRPLRAAERRALE
jgi:flavin-dependent dehydrogenase